MGIFRVNVTSGSSAGGIKLAYSLRGGAIFVCNLVCNLECERASAVPQIAANWR